MANPETGAGEYMICGGLNGGSVVVPVTLTFLAGLIYTIVELAGLFFRVLGLVELLIGEALILPIVLLVLICIAMCLVVDRYISWQSDYMDFLLDGNVDAAFEMMYEFANDVETDAKITAVFGMSQIILRYLASTYGKAVREVLPDLSENVAKLEDLRKLLPEKYQKIDSEGNKIGNIAYSVSNIKDYNIDEMKSFSKYGSIKEDSIINKVEGWISNILNGRYYDDVLKVNPHGQVDAVNGYLRINDTEYKIIENYNQILKGDYKNIEIRVVDSKGGLYKVKGGVVQ